MAKTENQQNEMTRAPQKAGVLLFEGFEEIEALTPVDLLSRANISVTLAGIDAAGMVTGRSGISVKVKHQLKDFSPQEFDCLILPGGPGIARIRRHPLLCQTLRTQFESGSILGCICAAPLLMLDSGILPGIDFTCHPSAEDELPHAQNQAVVHSGKCITARGAGSAIPFSLALIRQLTDNKTAQSVAQAICYDD